MDFIGAGGIFTLIIVCTVIGLLLFVAAKLVK